MPYNNRNNRYNNNNGRNERGSGRGQQSKRRASGDYNMLSFGIGFFDEDGRYPKVRILLKKEDAKVGCVDEQENEYSREEAAALVAKALLEGRGISLYLFENNDGTMSGNARIDINGLDSSAKELTPVKSVKPKYEVPEEDEEDDDMPY